ncbi:MAG: FadR/GntR family transcriptional regulator [Pseudomonadota bacterium]
MSDQRLYQTIARRLKRRIRSGVYAPGGRLPGERELADEFGVSRVTIREALIALQAQSHIRIKTGSGAYVCERSPADNNGLPDVSPLELTEARLLFESEAAALAARAINEEDLARLDELVATLKDPRDQAESQAADHAFHHIIARASGNRVVLHTIETLWRMRNELAPVQDVHQAVCTDETAEERAAEHGAILEALRNRDPAAARRTMQAHFGRLLSSMIDATEERAVEELRAKSAASRQRFLSNLSDTTSN